MVLVVGKEGALGAGVGGNCIYMSAILRIRSGRKLSETIF